MLKRIGLPAIALLGMLTMAAAPAAQAGVRFGVYFGGPAPVYRYAPPPVPYYAAPAPAYAYPNYAYPYYGWREHRRNEVRDRRWDRRDYRR